jgi:hypothetical protein
VWVTTSTFDAGPADVGDVETVDEDVRGSDEQAASSKAPTNAVRIATPRSYDEWGSAEWRRRKEKKMNAISIELGV